MANITVQETQSGITAFVSGLRASADLSKIEVQDFDDFNLPEGDYKWLYFNRLINDSGQAGLGLQILKAVLKFCDDNGLAILNEVSAYGRFTQSNLERYYINEGFKPVDIRSYGNKLLVYIPKGY